MKANLSVEDFLEDLLLRGKRIKDIYERNFLLWNIITALRGPDDINNRLKVLTTSRIRAVVGLCSNIGQFIVMRDGLSAQECIDRELLLAAGQDHFNKHCKAAYRAILALYNYDLFNEREGGKES